MLKINDNNKKTNKDFMSTLDTSHFEAAMYALYFNPKLWVYGNEVKQVSTPNMFDVCKWLDSPCDIDSSFWKYILSGE